MSLTVPSDQEVSFDYGAFDLDETLFVAMKIFDQTAGLPGVLVDTIPMTHCFGGGYIGKYTFPDPHKLYLVHRGVYTDGTYGTIDTNRGPAISAVRTTPIEDEISTLVSTDWPSTVWDAPRVSHDTPLTFGAALQGELTAARAAKIDLIDVPVSSRVDTVLGLQIHALAQGIVDLIGTPPNGNIGADLGLLETVAGAIAAKTSQLVFSAGNVLARAAVVDDKTGYQLTPAQLAAIEAGVWDIPLASHVAPGSTGEALAAGAVSSSPSTIADAVWDKARAAHTAAGTFGEAVQGVITPARAAALDNVDAPISSLESEASASGRYTNIQTHLGAIDTELAVIDGQIPPTLASDVAAIKTETDKIGSPATGTVGGALAQVKGDTVKIGTPAGASIAADIAAVETKLGAPAGASVSADVAAIKADTVKIGAPAHGTLAADDAAIEALIGAPVTTLAGDIAQVKGQNVVLDAKIGSPAGTVATDIAAVKADTTTLTGRLTTGRATKLDNLDVPVSSREAESDAASRYAQEETDHAAILAAVGSIPNNTTFVGIVPTELILPSTGSKTYTFYVNLFDQQGHPQDADSNQVNVTIKDTTGFVVVASTPMFRIDVGRYSYAYTVNDSDPQRALNVFFDYLQNAIAFTQPRVTNVVEFDTKLGAILALLTPTRAANLDKLDVNVSTRESAAHAASEFSTVIADVLGLNTPISQILSILGLPGSGTVAGDLALIISKVGMIGNPVTGTLAGDIAQVELETSRIGTTMSGSVTGDIGLLLSRIGSPVGLSLVADVAAVKGDTNRIGVPANGTLAADIAQVYGAVTSPSPITSLLNAIASSITMLNGKIGTPLGTVSTDIAAVGAALGTPAHGSVAADLSDIKSDLDASVTVIEGDIAAVSAAVAALDALSNLIKAETDKIGAPVLASLALDIAAIQTKIGTPGFATVIGDITNVLNKVLLIPTAPLLVNDPRLANLDAPISTRCTPANLANAAQGLNMVEVVGVLDDINAELVGVIDEAA